MKTFTVQVVTKAAIYETTTSADSVENASDSAVESCAIAFNVAFDQEDILDIIVIGS